MANDQIEYCGKCPHYANCSTRIGKGEECVKLNHNDETESSFYDDDDFFTQPYASMWYDD